MKKYVRKTGVDLSSKRVTVDPRCWRTIYRVRLLLMEKLGYMPSFDFAVSEVLVDADNGAGLLRTANARFANMPCPGRYGPAGNRFRAASDPNRAQRGGSADQDWGVSG